jgi:predicted nucleic acid-binding protein
MSRALQAVLDTNVIVSISRAPTTPPNDKLTAAIEGRRLRVCVDATGGIVSEWQNTAKRDVVQQLIIHWQQFKGWQIVAPANALPRDVSRALQQMAFKDAVDKLILRTALHTDDKRVVSNDPDFWDPKDQRRVGDANAPVARLCREELHITVSRLKETVDALSKNGAASSKRRLSAPLPPPRRRPRTS